MAYTRLSGTTEDHIRGGNHVLYETIMFFNDAALLDDRDRWTADHGWEPQTLYMAVVESLLVHRRNLMDFYFPHPKPDRRRKHDVIAADFCASWTEARSASFKIEFDAIGEQILHLTYLRREVAPSWNYGQMRDEFRALTMKFVDAADDRLHERIKAQLREIARGERTTGRAVTLVSESGSLIDPATLSGLTPGLSTPTSTTLADRDVS